MPKQAFTLLTLCRPTYQGCPASMNQYYLRLQKVETILILQTPKTVGNGVKPLHRTLEPQSLRSVLVQDFNVLLRDQ